MQLAAYSHNQRTSPMTTTHSCLLLFNRDSQNQRIPTPKSTRSSHPFNILENLQWAASPPVSTSIQSNSLSSSSWSGNQQARALQNLPDLELNWRLLKLSVCPRRTEWRPHIKNYSNIRKVGHLTQWLKEMEALRENNLDTTYLRKHITDHLQDKLVFITAYT